MGAQERGARAIEAREPSDRPNRPPYALQTDEQSEQETDAGGRAAEADKDMRARACAASTSCCMVRGARARHQWLQRWPSRTHRIR
jgi:hypothetical protein